MQWKISPKKSDDLTEQLLVNRGIIDKDKFFNPDLNDFEKNLNLSGISKASARIKKAIDNQELIIAYGDYDVDGVCGAAILYLGLTSIGAKVLPYIPHREKEGYGLSKVGLEAARDLGASLVISTDCGIVSFNEAILAKELGLDLIITDHHQILDNKYPDAFAIVHSLEICGGAVAWCLVRNLIPEKSANQLLDLVALCSISDMMSLTGVNRALVFEGLKVLNKTNRVGLLELFKEAGIKRGKISSYEIGHVIAPRLNAMGRLDNAIDSLRLLCTKDPVKASKLAQLVADTNNQRKELTQMALVEAKAMVKKDKKVNVLYSKNWNAGIIGLIAGRVCDETGCASIAISVGEEFSKGSARAGKGINIVESIRACSDILEAVGGHESAAGFTIRTEKIEEFAEKLEKIMAQNLISEHELEIEAEIDPNKLNLKLVNDLEKFEPFGVGNPQPVLSSNNIRVSDLRTLSEGKHLKGKAEGIDFIGFGMGEMMNLLQNGQLVNLAYNLEINRFNGSEKLQLKLRDLQII